MAEPHAHSQPIKTYGPAQHNRNIWPSPTPTANQYKHMAEPHTIDYVTPGRFFCLRWFLPSNHYSRATVTNYHSPYIFFGINTLFNLASPINNYRPMFHIDIGYA